MDKSIKVTSKKNPIIPRRGVCDPHVHVFGDRMWLYASHDAVPDNPVYCMHDWQIWSSADCIEWQLERVVRPEDTHMGASDCCWAVDCAERDGKYYYYFSDKNEKTGVLVGDSPAGPFCDVLGKPLLDGTLTTTREYDPSVFRDDDGEYYIAFGGPKWCYGEGAGYYIARLNEDMISLAEIPRYIELDHMGDDKISINKIAGRYYLSYGGFYAISDSVYGPYRFMGHTGASMDHSSFVEWNGQLFHAITVNDCPGHYRSSGLCYVHVRENGELVTDPLIVEYGVGQYDSDWNRIEAEWFMRGQNVRKVENEGLPGFSVACDGTQAVLTYPKVRGLADKVGLFVYGRPVGGDTTVEVRKDNENGKLLGSITFRAGQSHLALKSRGDRRACYFEQPMDDVTDICLVMKPERGATFSADYFCFFKTPIDNH